MKFIKSFFSKSELLNVSSANSLALIIKLGAAFITSKLTAIFLGTTGISLLGNWRNATELIQKLSTGTIQHGVVKYTADTQHNPDDAMAFQSSLWYFACIVCGLVMLICLLFAPIINTLVFIENDYSNFIRLLGVLLPLYVLNIYLQGILKGHQQFNSLIRINIFGHLLNLVIFSTSIYFFNLEGALFSVMVVPILVGVYTFYIAYTSKIVLYRFNISLVKRFFLLGFKDYVLMSIISAIIFPLTYLGIRKLLAQNISLEASGYWEAMFRVSNLYVLFALSLINLVVLPKLANAKSLKEFRFIVFEFYKQIIPFFVIGLILIFVLKEWIVKLVLTNEFMPVTNLFLWQEVGDLFRVLALVMVYQFHAKKMIWHYILTDVFLALGLYVTTFSLVDQFGLQSAVISHAIIYFIYFLIILFIFRKPLIFKSFKTDQSL